MDQETRLSILEAEQFVPGGYRIVPVVPTPEMLHAAFGTCDDDNAWRLTAAVDAFKVL